MEREHYRVQRNMERAEKAGVPATLTFNQWVAILYRYKWKCARCRGAYDTMEHLTRLKDGGGTTATNCVPMCAKCNCERNQERQWECRIFRELGDMVYEGAI